MRKTFLAILLIPLLLLALTFSLGGIAKENAQREHVYLLETLLPDGKDFVKLDYVRKENDLIQSVHKAQNGYVIKTATKGYADEITMLIGVSNDGKVTGLVTLDAHETPGLGNGILTNHKFLSQFLNQSGSFVIGSESTPDAESSGTSETPSTGADIYVDGISGATVSSMAVARCVNAAIAYVTGADVDSSATS